MINTINMNTKHFLWAVLAAAALFLTGCNKEDSEPAPEITPTGSSVAQFSSGIQVSAAATDVTLTFTSAADWQAKADASWIVITPASGKKGDISVVVSVEKNEALEARSAKVTVSSGDISKAVTVTQAGRDKVLITGVTLDRPDATLYIGDTITLIATVSPSHTDEDKTVTWSSSNEAVASVAGGVVTALSEGETVITAKAGSFEATCKVTVAHKVVEVESVTLDKTEAALYIGETVTLVATVNPSNADDKTVTWTSSNEAVAVVTGGVVTALAEGEAVITAKAGGKTATCKVVVSRKGSGGEDLGGEEDVDPWN